MKINYALPYKRTVPSNRIPHPFCWQVWMKPVNWLPRSFPQADRLISIKSVLQEWWWNLLNGGEHSSNFLGLESLHYHLSRELRKKGKNLVEWQGLTSLGKTPSWRSLNHVRKMSGAFSGSGCHGGIFVASWVAKLDDRLHGEPGGARYPDTNKPYKEGQLPAINGLRTPISMVFFTPGKHIYFRPLIGAWHFDDFASFLTIGSGLVPCPNCWIAWLQSFLLKPRNRGPDEFV